MYHTARYSPRMDAYDLELNLLFVADCLRSPILNDIDNDERLNAWVLHEYVDTASTLDTRIENVQHHTFKRRHAAAMD